MMIDSSHGLCVCYMKIIEMCIIDESKNSKLHISSILIVPVHMCMFFTKWYIGYCRCVIEVYSMLNYKISKEDDLLLFYK